jgi:hypothetical protein
MRAVLEALVKRTELSMLTRGVPLSRARKHGGIEKLLPVLITASYLPLTRLEDSKKAFRRFGTNSLVGVLAPRGFNKEFTLPNLLKRSLLNRSPSGTKKSREALP